MLMRMLIPSFQIVDVYINNDKVHYLLDVSKTYVNANDTADIGIFTGTFIISKSTNSEKDINWYSDVTKGNFTISSINYISLDSKKYRRLIPYSSKLNVFHNAIFMVYQNLSDTSDRIIVKYQPDNQSFEKVGAYIDRISFLNNVYGLDLQQLDEPNIIAVLSQEFCSPIIISKAAISTQSKAYISPISEEYTKYISSSGLVFRVRKKMMDSSTRIGNFVIE